MLFFIICLSICFTIFFVTSAVVLMRRRQQARQNVGFIINATGAPAGNAPTHFQHEGVPVQHYTQGGVPVTQYNQNGVPVIHYPPPSYQSIQYPYQTSSQVSVQLVTSPGTHPSNPPAMQQRAVSEVANAVDASVLPSADEKRAGQQSHAGAVETAYVKNGHSNHQLAIYRHFEQSITLH